MSVARRVDGALEDLADQVGQGGGGGQLLQLLADVALVLARSGEQRAARDRGRDGGRRTPLPPASAVEPLEGQGVEPLGRDQVQFEDRLPQVAWFSTL